MYACHGGRDVQTHAMVCHLWLSESPHQQVLMGWPFPSSVHLASIVGPHRDSEWLLIYPTAWALWVLPVCGDSRPKRSKFVLELPRFTLHLAYSFKLAIICVLRLPASRSCYTCAHISVLLVVLYPLPPPPPTKFVTQARNSLRMQFKYQHESPELIGLCSLTLSYMSETAGSYRCSVMVHGACTRVTVIVLCVCLH